MIQTQFQVALGATYECREIGPETADYFGCPGADTMLVGRNGHMIGYLMAAGRKPGALVKVPGWSTRRGLRVTFVPWGTAANGEPLEGYLGE